MKITSPQNSNFKFWRELKSAKAIRESRQFFLMGEKIVKEFLSWSPHHPAGKKFSILSEIYPDSQTPLTSGETNQFELPNGLFKEIDFIGTNFNLLLLEFKEFEKADFTSAPKNLELIAPLGDPGNMGALIRSALAFQAKKIFLTKESCHPFHPRAFKASAGASLLMDFAQSEESFLDIPVHSHDYFLDQDGQSIFNFSWPKNLRLWLGEEGPGLSSLSKKFPKQILTIPSENVESLNATVAASIAICEWSQKTQV